MIVDTHVHVISDDRQRYPITPTGQTLPWVTDSEATAEQLLALMDGAGVDRAIVVQAFGAYAYDNSYHADSAAQHTDRLIGICIVNPLEPDAPSQLRYWIRERRMAGLRFFATPPEIQLDSSEVLPTWEAAAVLGVPVCILTAWDRLAAVQQMAARFSDIPIALDHMGMFHTPEEHLTDSGEQVLQLARLPNLYLKISTINLLAALGRGEAGMDFFRRVVESFGPQRLMWGTNYPNSRNGSYADMVALGRQVLPFLSDDDRRWIMGDTAASLWPRLRE